MKIARLLPVVCASVASLATACGGRPGGESLGAAGSAVTACAGSTTLKGVDVSHWDGTVNWTEAKASGISFAFAKATEGTGDKDDTFAANWAGMKAAGVVRGAYHFFDPAADPVAQANFILSVVGTLGADDLPIVCDFEQLDGESEATAVARAATFLSTVTAATGKKAILYMSSEFLGSTYASLEPYTLWVADYGPSCPILPPEWSSWAFWQYSDTGSVSGLSSAVDMDTFNGSLSELLALAGGGSSGSGGSSSSGSSSGSSGSGSSSGGSSSGGSSGGGSSSSSSSSGGGAASPDACSEGNGYCTETLQCDSGHWIVRQDDPAACTTVVNVAEPCNEPPGYCTATLQCDGDFWVPRQDDSAACTSGPGG